MRNRLLPLALLLVPGCATLPAAAPTAHQVVAPAGAAGVTVVDIVDAPGLGAEAVPEAPAWPIADAAPADATITVGDRVTVTVFEVGYALFGAARDDAAPAAAGRTLPRMEVGEGGSIDLPYIGAIEALGRTPDAVAAEIERRLRGLSQNAQASVTVDRGPARSVIVSGDVKTPGRQPLTSAGERLLDVIAVAGGPTARGADTAVRVTRAGQSAEIRLDRLHVGDVANVRLAPGDHVELLRSVRSVTVLGAARTVSEVPFDSDALSLAEALARAGGPLDNQADATGVFVFRYEPALVDGVRKELPVIYRLNLLDPRSYFAAQRFRMHEKDVLLIANARSAQFGKLVQLLNTLVTPALTVELLTR
ncbi:polysaccharide export protein [Sphingomonas sp. HITSZ_GF]|uniref:polysaccharide biosynthesis/export family protein n=1 Tax=Sphingomonas sp. HITSZ_GF TaxID=3037247 RepID=UPI00240D722E|nr:polysaccharide biosynthesis/export family protein [Sphingomonas sp. HITSZ_GF]MDG2533787.1 polysaccharide export protein [Sphingomonas sp. HITSZ_GF]